MGEKFHFCIYIDSQHILVAVLLREEGQVKMIGLFYRISSLLQGSFAKETYNFKEPTNRSHPIRCFMTPPQGVIKHLMG